MDFWIIFLAFIILSLIYRTLTSLNNLIKLKRLHKLYQTDLNKFIEESEISLSLFKEAGLKDYEIKVTIESDLVLRTAIIDIPQYHQQNISIFDNITYNHQDVTSVVNKLFLKSKGVFRYRLKECLNPLFWIQ
jgi:hypothetical protein